MRRLAILLTVVFFFAMLMGAGPGLFLINGKGPVMNAPAIYAWAVFWFFVEATTLVIANFTIWKRKD